MNWPELAWSALAWSELAWNGLGWIASAVVVASLLQARRRRLHLLNLFGCALAAAYSTALGIWPTVALNVALATVNVVQLLRRPEPAPAASTPTPTPRTN